MKKWEAIFSEDDRELLKTFSGDEKQPFGGRPALIIVDVVRSFMGSEPLLFRIALPFTVISLQLFAHSLHSCWCCMCGRATLKKRNRSHCLQDFQQHQQSSLNHQLF